MSWTLSATGNRQRKKCHWLQEVQYILEGRQRYAGKTTQFNAIISVLVEKPATGNPDKGKFKYVPEIGVGRIGEKR